MKVCLACYHNRLASVLERAPELKVYTMEDNKICPAGSLSLPSNDPMDRTSAIFACGAKILICGAICVHTQRLLETAGIEVISLVRGDIDEVIMALKTKTLHKLAMPGCMRQSQCRGQGRGMGQGRGQGRGQGMDKMIRNLKTPTGDGKMKIAITCQKEGMDSPIDLRFGRAAGFMIVDLETGETSFADNAQNLSLPQGAGIQAAQNVAATGAKAVITGHVGPKAYLALNKGGIEIFLGADGSVSDMLEAYKGGKLSAADSADKDGHW